MAATLVLNFGHPLSDDASVQLAELVGEFQTEMVRVQLDMSQPVDEQVAGIVAEVSLTPGEWQTTPLLVVLPGATVAAACVLAELHGRSGQWPRIVSLVAGEDRVFRVGQVIDLNTLRNAARQSR